jgi:nucleoside-diphosphate-sugar epimerase
MKVLVTGASGFLGTAVVAQVRAAGHVVVAMVRPTAVLEGAPWDDPAVDVVRGDLRERGTWREAINGIDAVVHLAAAASGDLSTQFQGTVLGTENLLHALDRSSVQRFVHISSFSVYDFAALRAGALLDENSPLERQPERRDAYTTTKLVQEQLVREAFSDRSDALVVVRPGAIFGPVMVWDFGLSLTFGTRLGVLFAPRSTMRLTSVGNCADAITAALVSPRAGGTTVNIVDDVLPTHREFLRKCRAEGAEVPTTVVVPWWMVAAIGRLTDWIDRRWCGGRARLPEFLDWTRQQARWKPLTYTNDRARDVLGWSPSTTLRQAVAAMVAFERFAAERSGR